MALNVWGGTDLNEKVRPLNAGPPKGGLYDGLWAPSGKTVGDLSDLDRRVLFQKAFDAVGFKDWTAHAAGLESGAAKYAEIVQAIAKKGADDAVAAWHKQIGA